jgi:glutamate---cysteine ligase / carboxylate-amine ligase
MTAPTAAELRARFDAVEPLTIGLEEELMLLDPATSDLAPVAERAVRDLGDRRFKLELPATQLEIVVGPSQDVPEAIAALARGRRDLVAGLGGLARPAGAGVHPFASPEGVLNRGERYERTAREYGPIARRQLVCAFQVHVAVGGADRTLAVYNGLRSHLPELAALAANAPLYDGRDTGLASVRPSIGGLLPRQGMPPALESWEAFARELRWGTASGTVPEPGVWWWELRPHVAFGTLELRVPDAQTTLAEGAAVAAVAHALVAWLAERVDAGERPAPVPTWRIEENRWSAARWGVEGTLADLETGERVRTRDRLTALLDALVPVAERIGCGTGLASARALVERNGALRQRAVARERGVEGAAAWLTERFLDEPGEPAGA